jgi:CHAT domain-containing protein
LAPYPAAKAAALFGQLFGPNWQRNLKDIDHLLLVPEGPLTRLPFAVLLTETPGLSEFPPGGPQYREAAWLARRFDLSVLPSLSAISALRNQTRSGRADLPFIGIGDPLLDDHPANTRGGKRIIPALGLNRNVRNLEQLPQQLRQASDLRQARLQLLREQPSLPDTADELQAIAKLFPGTQALLLREQASEAQLKQSPLNRYNILSFATHGVLAEELGQGIEPGLILTPPKMATDQDDGYLSLSEVAQLQLNADWVVLSACNTAGGAEQEAEGLTGLAKAFAYAGAKALLVSHWAVSSQATVELMGHLFRGIQQQRLPRAIAHQQAMLRMIDSGQPELSHPSLWAPFVVVGDGG